tara:strand:- start:189 stop:641 length:453 start_codon:yes stop_codon:yes gene_type:complete
MIKTRKYLLIIFLILVSACGYEPLNKNLPENKIKISKKTFSGDNQINRKIFDKINLKESKDELGYELKLNSNKIVDQVAKDKSGNVTKYKTTITIVVELIENEKTIKKRSFSKSFNYSNLSNKFDLRKYQEDVETNLINSITRDIKIFLN